MKAFKAYDRHLVGLSQDDRQGVAVMQDRFELYYHSAMIKADQRNRLFDDAEKDLDELTKLLVPGLPERNLR